MQYVVTAIIVLIGLAAFGLLRHIWHLTRFEPRPSLAAARRVMSRSRLVVSVAGGECPCGGMLGPTGTVSPRYGQLLGCTNCGRTWTDDGRRVIRRSAGRSARHSAAGWRGAGFRRGPGGRRMMPPADEL